MGEGRDWVPGFAYYYMPIDRLACGHGNSSDDSQKASQERNLGIEESSSAVAATRSRPGRSSRSRANRVVAVEGSGDVHLRRSVLNNHVKGLVALRSGGVAADDIQKLGVGIVRQVGDVHGASASRPGSTVRQDREHGTLGNGDLMFRGGSDRSLVGIERSAS